jgi:predicted nucleic acid-binding Zn ribbon protein
MARADTGGTLPGGWPRGPRGLSQKLKRLAPLLRTHGVEWSRGKDGGHRKTWFRVSSPEAASAPDAIFASFAPSSVDSTTAGVNARDANAAKNTPGEVFGLRENMKAPGLSATPDRRRCARCGEPLEARKKHAKFCSDRCRQRAAYDRRKANGLAEFTPTTEWQLVPEGAVLPPGLQTEMDLTAGQGVRPMVTPGRLRAAASNAAWRWAGGPA